MSLKVDFVWTFPPLWPRVQASVIGALNIYILLWERVVRYFLNFCPINTLVAGPARCISITPRNMGSFSQKYLGARGLLKGFVQRIKKG